MDASLKQHYAKVLENGRPMIDAAEYAETKTPRYVKPYLGKLIAEVEQLEDRLSTTLPGFIEGAKVAYLGCSAGKAAFLLAAMVGPGGHVYAFDPDPACIETASALIGKQTEALGYSEPNIEFAVGFGEEIALPDASVDVVVTNALFNASPDQDRYLDEMLRVLKPGGEVCLSAVFTSKHRLGAETRASHPVKCNYLSGALYSSDMRRMFNKRGIYAMRYFEKRFFNDKPLRKVVPKAVKKDLKGSGLYFGAVRTFKLSNLEDSCENYKLEVTYQGTAPGHEQFFDLDDTHRFFADEPLEVCGNTFAFVMDTRFSKYFEGTGDRSRHYGIYDYCEYCSGGIGGKIEGSKEPEKGGGDVFDLSRTKICSECTVKDCSSCL